MPQIRRFDAAGNLVGERVQRYAANDPSIAAISTSKALTNIAIMDRPTGFIADIVMPRVDAGSVDFTYYTWSNNEIMKIDPATGDDVLDGRVAVGSHFHRDTSLPVKATGSTELYGLETVIHDREILAQDQAVDIETGRTMVLNTQFLLWREWRVRVLYASTASLTNNATLSGTAQWNDYTGSNPKSDLDTAIESVTQKSGSVPNLMWCNLETFNELRRHPDILDLTKHTKTGLPGAQEIVDAFIPTGGARLLISPLTYVSTKEGQTATKAWVWPDYFWIAYVPPTPGKFMASLGYQFVLQDLTVKTYREEAYARSVLQLSEDVDEVVTDANAGYVIVDAIA